MSGPGAFLVVGGDGLIGQALVRRLAAGGRKVWATTRRPGPASPAHIPLDLGDNLSSWRPPADCSVVLLCAAVTNQEKCRQDPEHTRRLNVTQTVELARTLIKAGSFVVFLSTNLVFDGTKSAAAVGENPNPQTEYGRQKVLAEQSLLALGPQVAVVRLSKVFHREMPLLKKWATALRRAETINPLDDLLCSPIAIGFVVEALQRISEQRTPGIFQVSGERDLSYAEIALRLARHLKLDERLVQPKSSRQLGLQLEHLPAHTTMDVSRLVTQLNLSPPGVETTLGSFFADLSGF